MIKNTIANLTNQYAGLFFVDVPNTRVSVPFLNSQETPQPSDPRIQLDAKTTLFDTKYLTPDNVNNFRRNFRVFWTCMNEVGSTTGSDHQVMSIYADGKVVSSEVKMPGQLLDIQEEAVRTTLYQNPSPNEPSDQQLVFFRHYSLEHPVLRALRTYFSLPEDAHVTQIASSIRAIIEIEPLNIKPDGSDLFEVYPELDRLLGVTTIFPGSAESDSASEALSFGALFWSGSQPSPAFCDLDRVIQEAAKADAPQAEEVEQFMRRVYPDYDHSRMLRLDEIAEHILDAVSDPSGKKYKAD